jgi:predicted  nucleic acid-binding Zn-ribbon protein
MPRGSGHPDLSQRPRREAPGLLTGLAILERELGAIDYESHRLRRRLAQRLPKAEGDALRAELKALQRRHVATLRLLDEMHADYEERVERATEGIRARASRSPFTRRETPDEARRRLGLPGR